MASINIPSPAFTPTGPEGKNWVFGSTVASGDTVTVVLQNNTQDTQIKPSILTVDNIANAQPVTVNFGTYDFAVPPFTRESFNLPRLATVVTLTNPPVSSGGFGATCSFWLSDVELAPNQTNNLLVQQTAAATLTYAYVTVSVSRAQLASDLNKSILFAGMAANINYALLPIAGNVGNGWLQFVENRDTVDSVTITPSGADVINSVFNSGAPLTLAPGDSGILTSDGSGNWFFKGSVSYESVDITLAAAALSTLTHGLGKFPDVVLIYLVNRIAEGGYSVGDYLDYNPNLYGGGGGGIGIHALVPALATIAYRQASIAGWAIANKTTGVPFNITAADWKIRVKARAFW